MNFKFSLSQIDSQVLIPAETDKVVHGSRPASEGPPEGLISAGIG
jgi:hypothetical protein